MATRPMFDFSHLTPSERIELAEELWDSLESDALPLTERQTTELKRRRALLDKDPPADLGRKLLTRSSSAADDAALVASPRGTRGS